MDPVIEPLYPPVFPYAEHRLPVGDGYTLHIEECGRADGLPVLFLHGGPGSGCSPAQRRFFDPSRFRAVLFDQRGSGRSTPLGSLEANTTSHLVADLERIRLALGIEKWLVFGGSWGSLLALAYARQHPERLLGLVLRGIFLGSADELRSYAQGLDGAAPEAWSRFAGWLPANERDDVLGGYTRRLLAPDPIQAAAAARHWVDYERALMEETPLSDPPDARLLAKARIQAHYLSQGCFVESAGLLSACRELAHLPAAIVQGLQDPVCPPRTAEALRRALPQAAWFGVEGGRHGALAPAMAAACIEALDLVAGRTAR